MTGLRYEADGHRLRIAGGCRAADRDLIREALDAMADLADDHLIVDLTAVTEIDQCAANELISAARRSRGDGGTVAFLRKHGTSVDAALVAAEHAARVHRSRAVDQKTTRLGGVGQAGTGTPRS
jgi:anti-anti-sigma regulatory factor